MANHRPHKIARWIGNVLVIAGAVAVAVWAGSFLSLTVWQKWQSRVFDRQRSVPRASEPTPIENGGIVGRLAIPRLHMRAMVREGDSDRTLSIALGHIPGTALPGQPGNAGIAGHRDTLFRGLRDIAANDEITFETQRATYVYRVEGTRIVKPQDTSVLDPAPTGELTLVTCFPFEYVGSAPDRFIVRARLVSENAVTNDIRDEPPPKISVKELPVKALPVPGGIWFNVAEGHSRELMPGKIWFGLSAADATRGR